ncbi:hypothetical protein FUA23_14845 [Neolewinella aurantiaca]|uniref:Outer membrane protein beta-barrel domain-containing protein n=1 Tax=Neolewinella aurantiaca TaxID=2602767 RepID=A0A5C7FFN2_9BACT|nr:hypothetical protein [Neolewinella aurantiaca]TXF88412.1 hypothetical protein FUA23_14845 [Neolewinella aurantiaca]
MQAKKEQQWTDDAAFWDEAWADMNGRLDAAPPSRERSFVWWPFFLVFSAAIALAVYLAAFPSDDQDQPLSPTTNTGPEVVNTDGENTVATKPLKKTIVRNEELKERSSEASMKPGESQALASSSSPDRPVFSAPEPAAASAPSSPDVLPQPGQPETLRLPATRVASTTETANGDKPAPPNSNDVQEQRKPIAASPALPSSGMVVEPTKQDQKALLPFKSEPHRYRNPLTFAIAGTTGLNPVPPGISLGFGYRIKNGGRVSFPLSVRYRFDEIEVKDSPLNALLESDLSVGSPVNGSSDLLLIPETISSHALEISAGAAWEATPRLRFVSGLAAAYHMESFINFAGNTNSSFNGQLVSFENYDVYSLNSSRSADLLESLTQDGVAPDFSRWAFRAHLGVAYDLTPRFGAQLKLTRLIAQPDRTGIIQLQNNQLEFGVSYRFR